LAAERVAGSYRDRKGYVFSSGDRILRSVAGPASEVQREFLTSKVFEKLVADGRLIRTEIATDDPARLGVEDATLLLEHERIPFISYPYEWPFAALRAAALLHLDVHLKLLDHGYTLSDASAYNVQFRGPNRPAAGRLGQGHESPATPASLAGPNRPAVGRLGKGHSHSTVSLAGPEPVFIDVLSVERYVDGAYWNGHRQFCDQFLNPLLLSARLGIPYQALYRGRLEGIPSAELAPMLRWHHKLRPQTLLNVVLPARFESAARQGRVDAKAVRARRPLPRSTLQGMLRGLRRWIEGLGLPWRQTDWTSYAADNTYADAERSAKRDFVARAVAAAAPATVLDLGCNTGDYSVVALESGAESVIGAEADPATADLAFRRAQEEKLRFLPVVQDAANPSPAQGWREAERPSFTDRVEADFLLALAVVHHLAIGRNIPLAEAVGWLVGLAPRGVIEFVQKDDTTVRRMLALREDIFTDYTEDIFRNQLSVHARIVEERKVSEEGRLLFRYDRER
jgi:SAM-dependent methyltransferase